MKQQRQFVVKAEKLLATVLGVSAKVKLVEPQSIKRHEGKAIRVIDRRDQ
jgi:phenylacetate-CoA ligase